MERLWENKEARESIPEQRAPELRTGIQHTGRGSDSPDSSSGANTDLASLNPWCWYSAGNKCTVFAEVNSFELNGHNDPSRPKS